MIYALIWVGLILFNCFLDGIINGYSKEGEVFWLSLFLAPIITIVVISEGLNKLGGKIHGRK